MRFRCIDGAESTRAWIVPPGDAKQVQRVGGLHVDVGERLDDHRTMDLFPFITWDRKGDGYRQFSFLWRLYRNERKAGGGRNLDLLFLPLMRSKRDSGH